MRGFSSDPLTGSIHLKQWRALGCLLELCFRTAQLFDAIETKQRVELDV